MTRALAVARPDYATCVTAPQNCMSEGPNRVEFNPNPLKLIQHPCRVRRRSVAFHENTRASGSESAIGRVRPSADGTRPGRRPAGRRSTGTAFLPVDLAAERHARRQAIAEATLPRNRFRFPECRGPTLCRNETWRSSSYVFWPPGNGIPKSRIGQTVHKRANPDLQSPSAMPSLRAFARRAR